MRNDCVGCKHASWVMTNHSPQRINKVYLGKCNHPVTYEMLKRAIPESFLKSYVFRDVVQLAKRYEADIDSVYELRPSISVADFIECRFRLID